MARRTALGRTWFFPNRLNDKLNAGAAEVGSRESSLAAIGVARMIFFAALLSLLIYGWLVS